jgi:hypothetical protein
VSVQVMVLVVRLDVNQQTRTYLAVEAQEDAEVWVAAQSAQVCIRGEDTHPHHERLKTCTDNDDATRTRAGQYVHAPWMCDIETHTHARMDTLMPTRTYAHTHPPCAGV